MDVIGHEQGEVCVPIAADVPVLDCFGQRFRDRRERKLVNSTLLAANGGEVDFYRGINPRGRIMRQRLSRRHGNARSIVVGTPRCGVRRASLAGWTFIHFIASSRGSDGAARRPYLRHRNA